MEKIEIKIITIYSGPQDIPEYAYVAREWSLLANNEIKEGEIVAVDDDLETIRKKIQNMGGQIVIPRDNDDDPCIVESWLC